MQVRNQKFMAAFTYNRYCHKGCMPLFPITTRHQGKSCTARMVANYLLCSIWGRRANSTGTIVLPPSCASVQKSRLRSLRKERESLSKYSSARSKSKSSASASSPLFHSGLSETLHKRSSKSGINCSISFWALTSHLPLPHNSNDKMGSTHNTTVSLGHVLYNYIQ